jgi:hypothetical protein
MPILSSPRGHSTTLPNYNCLGLLLAMDETRAQIACACVGACGATRDSSVHRFAIPLQLAGRQAQCVKRCAWALRADAFRLFDPSSASRQVERGGKSE